MSSVSVLTASTNDRIGYSTLDDLSRPELKFVRYGRILLVKLNSCSRNRAIAQVAGILKGDFYSGD